MDVLTGAKYGERLDRRPCPGAGCLTLTTAHLCQFCTRTSQLAEQGRYKPCIRCVRYLPVTDFGGSGRYRLCDDCRDAHPMTADEKRISKFMAREDPRRRRERDRAKRLRAAA